MSQKCPELGTRNFYRVSREKLSNGVIINKAVSSALPLLNNLL